MNKPQGQPLQLAVFLKQHRQQRGLSIDDLAEKTGIDRSTINRLENGRIAAPDPLKLQKLASALGTPVEDYFALVGYFTPHGLPGLKPYLRAKYGADETTAQEVEDYLRYLQDRNNRSEDAG